MGNPHTPAGMAPAAGLSGVQRSGLAPLRVAAEAKLDGALDNETAVDGEAPEARVEGGPAAEGVAFDATVV